MNFAKIQAELLKKIDQKNPVFMYLNAEGYTIITNDQIRAFRIPVKELFLDPERIVSYLEENPSARVDRPHTLEQLFNGVDLDGGRDLFPTGITRRAEKKNVIQLQTKQREIVWVNEALLNTFKKIDTDLRFTTRADRNSRCSPVFVWGAHVQDAGRPMCLGMVLPVNVKEDEED